MGRRKRGKETIKTTVRVFSLIALIIFTIWIYNTIIISKYINNESISSSTEVILIVIITIAIAIFLLILCLKVSTKSDESRKKELYLKIKELMEKESSRISIETFKNIIGIGEDLFNKKILGWALEFNFKIDGDYIIVNKETFSDFINELDDQFAKWEKMEKDKEGKL